MSAIAINNISLYVPHVFPNFDREYVAAAFKDIGEVSQIDFVAKQDRTGRNFNAAYVHFNKWYNNKKAASLYENVVDEFKEARLYYDNNWYWIVLPNTAKKHIPGDRKARIDLSELKTNTEEKEKEKEKENKSEELDASDYEFYAQMDEIEDMMAAEDANLIQIDGRYVQQIETENQALRMEIAQLRAALINMNQMYQAEKTFTSSVDL